MSKDVEHILQHILSNVNHCTIKPSVASSTCTPAPSLRITGTEGRNGSGRYRLGQDFTVASSSSAWDVLLSTECCGCTAPSASGQQEGRGISNFAQEVASLIGRVTPLRGLLAQTQLETEKGGIDGGHTGKEKEGGQILDSS